MYNHTLSNGEEVFGLYSHGGKGFIVPKTKNRRLLHTEKEIVECKTGRMGIEKYGWRMEQDNEVHTKYALTWLDSEGKKKYLKIAHSKYSTSTLQEEKSSYQISRKHNPKKGGIFE